MESVGTSGVGVSLDERDPVDAVFLIQDSKFGRVVIGFTVDALALGAHAELSIFELAVQLSISVSKYYRLADKRTRKWIEGLHTSVPERGSGTHKRTCGYVARDIGHRTGLDAWHRILYREAKRISVLAVTYGENSGATSDRQSWHGSDGVA